MAQTKTWRRETIRGFNTIVLIGAFRILREPHQIAATLLIPLMFFVMFGLGVGSLLDSTASYRLFAFSGAVVQTEIMLALSVGMSIVWDRESGFLRELLAAPVSRTGLLLGRLSFGAVFAAMEAALLLLIGGYLFDIHIELRSIPLLATVMLSTGFLFSALGAAMGSGAKSNGAALTFFRFLLLPLIFLSNLFVPLSRLPDWIQTVGSFNPVSRCADALRSIIFSAKPEIAQFSGVDMTPHALWENLIIIFACTCVLWLVALLISETADS